MHWPDPKFGPDKQDKRSVVAIEIEDVDAWLFGARKMASRFVKLAPVEVVSAQPA